MRDFIDIGPAPFAEEPVQVGCVDYVALAEKECDAFIAELKNKYGNPPYGARLAKKFFDHDFGGYYSVVCWFDTNNDASIDYAYDCEMGLDHWTEIGRSVLNNENESATYSSDDILDEILGRADDGDFDYSDIFDGDIVDLI